MKYFFLSQGWRVGRVWESTGLWNEIAWRRKPQIALMGVYLVDGTEKMALYKVEEAVQMVEVFPEELDKGNGTRMLIGQVRITRLVSADRALERITPIH